MKIYKYEFREDIGNQHDYYKYQITHEDYFSSNTIENRSKFISSVGVKSEDFLKNISSDWFGYRVIEIDVK